MWAKHEFSLALLDRNVLLTTPNALGQGEY